MEDGENITILKLHAVLYNTSCNALYIMPCNALYIPGYDNNNTLRIRLA